MNLLTLSELAADIYARLLLQEAGPFPARSYAFVKRTNDKFTIRYDVTSYSLRDSTSYAVQIAVALNGPAQMGKLRILHLLEQHERDICGGGLRFQLDAITTSDGGVGIVNLHKETACHA